MDKRTGVLTVLLLSVVSVVQAQVQVVDSNVFGQGDRMVVAQVNGTSRTGAGVSGSTPAQGMLFNQLEQLQREMAALRGMLEEQQNQIQQLRQENLQRYQELDRRLSGPVSASAAGSGNAAAAKDTASAASSSVAVKSAAAADPAKEKLYYDAAFDLIKSRDFDKARQAFTAFLQRYPNSQYAGNAEYWLGEVNLAQNDLAAAKQAFTRVMQVYPKHAKEPDALFKLADVERRLGNSEQARALLNQIVSQYPNSSAAKLARRDLDSLF